MIPVEELLPHRPPMLFVDEIVELVPGDRITCAHSVTGSASMPGVLLLESWAQAALLLVVWDAPHPDTRASAVPIVGRFGGVRFGRNALPGETIEHRVKLNRLIAGTAFLSGRSLIDGEIVLEVDRLVGGTRLAADLRNPGEGSDR
ncbi:hypothetical protein DMC61_21955 [Amycolatopsis sp. WAC 04169]|uniref:3-hydroxyacyl-ACP dehydratase FabZ family protein n=1 Tax=Amycolatopsis sp. WAC 04169 TaxID=2203197 RepID=UPI000F7BB056|nr:hypothetical protein [Amycolatopsis sp. WAC 04169]RSN29167.1 hypothetical protein DMC61_21955 [Amycolatopsis sp. WAC 04169]